MTGMAESSVRTRERNWSVAEREGQCAAGTKSLTAGEAPSGRMLGDSTD